MTTPSKEIFVPTYEWNAHYDSVAEAVAEGRGDYPEGAEFKMVRLTVHAETTYRIVNGQPVPVSVAYPGEIG